MVKKVCPPKKKPVKKGLAGAAQCGGQPLEVSISRASLQLPLRDLFAAFALAGLLSSSDPIDDDFLLEGMNMIADQACIAADAMMKRRLEK